VFLAFPVPAGRAPAAVEGMRALGIQGLSVTMPHKAAVAEVVDRLTPSAAALGAVNCVFRDAADGALVGDNTDGAGFLAGLHADFGLDVAGTRCVVVGAGGAARAVILALAGAGAASVRVVNRDAERGERAAALAGSRGAVAGLDAVVDADLVVNATPVGMGGDDAVPVPVDRLRADQVVADLVYHPARTPLMAAAEAAGARTANGVSMLVHQAAVAFEHWTGRTAPLEAMRSAVTSPADPGA
jgi:shikimate dehydrogenase